MQDSKLNFADQQAIADGTEVISTNVYDAGSAVKLFEGVQNTRAFVEFTAGTSSSSDLTLRARLVGADNAALTSNPITIADTGVSAAKADFTEVVKYDLNPAHQTTAKRYYGLFFDLGGTSPTATVNAFIAFDAQSRLVS